MISVRRPLDELEAVMVRLGFEPADARTLVISGLASGIGALTFAYVLTRVQKKR